ncbi:molybdopterin-synthase adenylyltransferase MoeB [Dokdonia sp.]|uniref:molybdopterin-synthase adenylyltransferase MoeB n=1 Tax=Dokdonia sp. TaxID=2024995 RepID=UPI003266628A
MSRYNRHIILNEIGEIGQDKIHAAKVLMIGAGGLGCPILQYLVAAGVGTIGIVDFDTVDESNLQRQVLFNTASIGLNKAIIAKERLLQLNPTITIHSYPERLDSENVITIFEHYDIIVDGTDDFSTRYLISDAAIILDKPLVYGAIYKFEGQVTVFNYQKGPSYRCLFPDPPKKDTIPNCSEIGVLGVLPGIIGTMQANEVLKIILGIGSPLSGKLYCFNALTNQSRTIGITRNQEEIDKVQAQGYHFEVIDDSSFCTPSIPEITIEDTINEDIQYIDVREVSEQPRITLDGILEIPLKDLISQRDLISKNKKTIVFCQSGVRSARAVALLKEHNITNCFSLKGGVSAFAKALLK